MKKIIISILLTLPGFAYAQNFIGGTVDSVHQIIEHIERVAQTEMELRPRTDSSQDYLFMDSSRFIRLRVALKSVKRFEGTEVKSSSKVDYIVFSGPPEYVKQVFAEMKTAPIVTSSGELYIKTKLWNARIDDCKIENKAGVEMPGLSIWISKPY